MSISTTLLVLKILAYYQSVDAAYEEVKHVAEAHVAEINQGMETYGPAYVKELVDAIVRENKDKNLYMGFQGDEGRSGNFSPWPKLNKKNASKWHEIYFRQNKGEQLLHLYVRQYHYQDGEQLLMGYDLKDVDYIRAAFVRILVENIILSFILSFLLSLLLVWLLNRYLQRVNVSFDHIMLGDLGYRMKVISPIDQFGVLATNFNRMLEWINALVNTAKDSGNALAHDLRTPLSRHRLELVALSQNSQMPSELRQQVVDAIERVDMLVEMFDNILTIAKAESRSATELFERVNLADIVRDIVDFYEPMFEDKKVTIVKTLPDEDISILGDEQLLRQAVMNVIDNAAKYVPYKGTIDIVLSKNNHQVTLVIVDNGPGIPPHMIDKAKDRFFRADESRNTKGVGLGLSLVNAVAMLHRGVLELSNNDPGLKVCLTLNC
ncbi:MAG: HAMP domain-containing histidine kinase [Alphaproteobacteria bacterium]|nr:HAMP domain-containing histidine kinase [Alphaproteobacteria bacterium]